MSSLHLQANGIGPVIVLLLQYGVADGGKKLFCLPVISVTRKARPKRVVIQLQELFVERAILSSAKNHCAQVSITNRQGVDPLFGRPLVPQDKRTCFTER